MWIPRLQGLWLGVPRNCVLEDRHHLSTQCPPVQFWDGMEENRIHSLFLSSYVKSEEGVKMQKTPLRKGLGSGSLEPAASSSWVPGK